MTGKTHMAMGIAAGLILSKGQPEMDRIVLTSAAIIGSLFPDLDHPKAKLNQRLLVLKNKFYRTLFYLALTIGFLYLYFIKKDIIFVLIGVMTLLISISSHRGFTHSILGYGLSISIVKIISLQLNLPSMYTGFSVGFISHLIGDFFTVKGIKLFYPIDKNIAFPILQTANLNSIKNIFLMFVGLSLMYFLT